MCILQSIRTSVLQLQILFHCLYQLNLNRLAIIHILFSGCGNIQSKTQVYDKCVKQMNYQTSSFRKSHRNKISKDISNVLQIVCNH